MNIISNADIDYHNTCDIFQTSVKVKLTKDRQTYAYELRECIYMFSRKYRIKAINMKKKIVAAFRGMHVRLRNIAMRDYQ